MSYTLDFPIQYIANPDRLGAIGLGKLYIGVVDGDPAFDPADRIQVYIARQNDTDLAIPQPINLTAGGVPTYLGSPVTLKINQSFSCAVLDRNDQQVLYSSKAGEIIDEINALEELVNDFSELTIENVSAIATFTPVAGRVYYLKEYNAGTGVGGGLMRSFAGSITENLATSFSAASGYYFERIFSGTIYASWRGITESTPDATAMLNALTPIVDAANCTLVCDIKKFTLSGVYVAPQRLDGKGCYFDGTVKFTQRKFPQIKDFTCNKLWVSGVWNANVEGINVTELDGSGLPIANSGEFLIDGREANWGTFWNTFKNVRCSNRIVIDVTRQAVNENQFVSCLGNGTAVEGLLITDHAVPLTTDAYTGGLVITNFYKGITHLGNTYSLSDGVSVPYTCTTWATDSANFTQRGIMESHNNTFQGCDFSQSDGAFNDVQVRNQTNHLTGCYFELGAMPVGNWNVTNTIIDGDSPPVTTQFNHNFGGSDVAMATAGDSISASVYNACVGGDWSQRKTDGAPVGFSASFAAEAVAVSNAPYGYTGIYGMPGGAPITGTFQYFDVNFSSPTGRFSAVVWIYAPSAELPVACDVLSGAGLATVSSRDMASIYNSGNGYYLMRISGTVDTAYPAKIRFYATNGVTTSRLCWLGAAFVSPNKATFFPMLAPSAVSETSESDGIESKRGSTGVSYSASSPLDVTVTYGEAFRTTGNYSVVVTVQADSAYLGSYQKSGVLSADANGFVYRIYFTSDFAGKLNWQSELC